MPLTTWVRSLLSAGLVLVGLIAFERLAPTAPASTAARAWAKAVKVMRKRDLNAEDLEAAAEGYYEGLLNNSARASRAGDLIAGRFAKDWTLWESQQIHVHQRRTGDFLYYEFRPDVRVTRGLDPIQTNSAGLADREYALVKPADTWRIAVLGDSIIRGHGVPLGSGFEALFEASVNDDLVRSGSRRRIEMLNFAVDGYRITQIMHVALVKTPEWSADCLLVALSDLSVFRKWGEHVAQLVHDGIDLRHDRLRRLVKEAGLRADDEPAAFDAKLAPFAIDVVSWALATIRDHAARRGANVVVLFVPPVHDPEGLQAKFARLAPVLDGLGLPWIDLTDTFGGIDDLDPLRISPQNHHPNVEGHRRLHEHLRRRLSDDLKRRAALLGE